MEIYAVKLGTGRVTHLLKAGSENNRTYDLSGADITCGRWSKSGDVDVVTGEEITCKSCTKIMANQTADEVLEDMAGTWHPVTDVILALRGSQRATAPGTDGPVRFRARRGKRKPSNHRRGW